MGYIIMKLENTYTIDEVIYCARTQGDFRFYPWQVDELLCEIGILQKSPSIYGMHTPSDESITKGIIKQHKKHYLTKKSFSVEAVGDRLFKESEKSSFWKYTLTDIGVKIFNEKAFTFEMYEFTKRELKNYKFTELGKKLVTHIISNNKNMRNINQ